MIGHVDAVIAIEQHEGTGDDKAQQGIGRDICTRLPFGRGTARKQESPSDSATSRLSLYDS